MKAVYLDTAKLLYDWKREMGMKLVTSQSELDAEIERVAKIARLAWHKCVFTLEPRPWESMPLRDREKWLIIVREVVGNYVWPEE